MPTIAQAQENVTREDMELIAKIVNRAKDIMREHGRPVDHDSEIVAAMKITLAHGGNCPVKLMQWLMSAQADFTHDFFGICSWIDTTNGEFLHGFWPIFAARPKHAH